MYTQRCACAEHNRKKIIHGTTAMRTGARKNVGFLLLVTNLACTPSLSKEEKRTTTDLGRHSANGGLILSHALVVLLQVLADGVAALSNQDLRWRNHGSEKWSWKTK